MSNVYGVTFTKGGKVYYFKTKDDKKCKLNYTVIVETEKGEQFATIVNEHKDISKIKNLEEMKYILRNTNKEDYAQYKKNIKDAEIALKKCKEYVKELKLNMNFVSASYNFSRTQLLFNFYADDRVDFRELAKKLAASFKTRIELRQIGARDKAKEVCGVGVCGQKLCCARYLQQMETVSINQAKNQNLALNPSKINGACNRLMCCLAYEDEVYTNNKKELPSYGDKIKKCGKVCTVKSVNVLEMKYKAECENNIIEFDANEDN